MNILWLTPDKPDNISVGRRRIADHLVSRGCNITLRGTTIKTIVKSSREIGKYDLIIGTTRAGAIAAVWLKMFHWCPIIVDHVDPIRQFEKTHPPWLSLFVRLAENISFIISDHVLYVYQEEEERVEMFSKNVSKTDLGVEAKKFTQPEPEVISTAKRQLRDANIDKNIVIYIGGLEPIYRIDKLLEAMSYLPAWSLILIGDGSLRESVEEASIQVENVYYLGSVPHEQIPGFLTLADVGVSLVDDPHTLKVLEYAAAGLSVVQLNGRAENRFGDLMTYTDPDPDQIAKSIQSAGSCERSTDLHSFAIEFDWNKIADDYAEAINNTI